MRPGPRWTVSDVTQRLRRLTAINMRWTAEFQEAIQELKELISTSTVAMHRDPAKRQGSTWTTARRDWGGQLLRIRADVGGRLEAGELKYIQIVFLLSRATHQACSKQTVPLVGLSLQSKHHSYHYVPAQYLFYFFEPSHGVR